MSRTLESEVASSITQSGHSNDGPYNELVAVLQPQNVERQQQRPPLQIEMLPSQYPLPPGVSVLVVDHIHVGVTKKTLVQAFITARPFLFQSLQQGSPHEDEQLKIILAASAAILLLDAEHLTAANARKRVLLARGGESKRILLDDELWFLDSLLTSSLHRHTKSPTLWSHRRWVLEQRRKAGSLPPNLEREVIDIGMVAAERHPRNYYAWNHLRWFILRFGQENAVIDEHQAVKVPVNWAGLVRRCRDWCYGHRDDISGWTFLFWLLKYIEPHSRQLTQVLDQQHEQSTVQTQGEGKSEISTDLAKSTILDVLEVLKQPGWHNESIEVFLRLSLGDMFKTQEEQQEIIETATSMAADIEQSSGSSVAQKALKWLSR